MKAQLFIVEDHYLVIEGIYSLLKEEKDIEWMGHAMNAASCLNFLSNHKPDVILMDINLPDKSGIDLCKEVKTAYPQIAVLGLSTFNQQAIIRNMMENGASGYVLKNATRNELLEAIATVMKGKQYLSAEVTLSLRENADRIPPLTRREKEVLKLIAEGLTNSEIAEKIFVSIPTVNTHRKSLLEKFNAKNTAILINKAAKLELI